MIAEKIPVLLLKTRSAPVDGYEEYFSNLDGGRFSPVFVPVLEHRYSEHALQLIKEHVIQGAFKQSDQVLPIQYGGLIFTSQRAVEAFTQIVEDLRHEGVNVEELLPSALPIYVVGPATARALRSLNLPCSIIGEETGNGEALATFILKHYNSLRPQDGGRTAKPGLLFMVGEQRRDIIPKTLTSTALPAYQRTDVEELTVYETGVMGTFEHDFAQIVHKRLAYNEEQWVIVFSPTGCKAMLEVLGMLDEVTGKVRTDVRPSHTYIATIGPTTRDYLVREFDFEPDVSAIKPSAEGLGEGILSFERS